MQQIYYIYIEKENVIIDLSYWKYIIELPYDRITTKLLFEKKEKKLFHPKFISSGKNRVHTLCSFTIKACIFVENHCNLYTRLN